MGHPACGTVGERPWYTSSMRLVFLPVLAILAGLLLFGCPPSSGSGGSKSGDPVTTCTSVGQSCLFSPGKLGLCVERTPPCEGDGSIICQSQH